MTNPKYNIVLSQVDLSSTPFISPENLFLGLFLSKGQALTAFCLAAFGKKKNVGKKIVALSCPDNDDLMRLSFTVARGEGKRRGCTNPTPTLVFALSVHAA